MKRETLALITSIVLLLAFVVFVVFMSVCSNKIEPAVQKIPESQSAQWTKLGDLPGDGLYRYTDSEAGVVCWVSNGYREAGLSCLPIEDTELQR